MATKKSTKKGTSKTAAKKPRGFENKLAAETKPQLRKRLERYQARIARWNKVVAKNQDKVSKVRTALKAA